MRSKYTPEKYRKPSGKIEGHGDLSGAVEDCQLYFLVGYRVANSETLPQWKPGTEFKTRRDALLQSAGVRQ